MSDKPASYVLDELFRFVKPPRGAAVIIRERVASDPTEPNWVAACSAMDDDKGNAFAQKVAELRRDNLRVDWSSVRKLKYSERVVLKVADLNEG